MDNYVSQVKQLAQDHLTDVKLSTNRISGDLTLQSTKLLCLSIPYSSGWHMYVDGKQVDIVSVDTWMLGAVIGSGTHSIVLQYQTPGLTSGLAAAGGALVFLVVFPIISNARLRKRGKATSRRA